MDRENIEKAVQTYFDAVNQSDMDALLALLHEDVAHDINGRGRQIGKQAFRNFYTQAFRSFDEKRSDVAIMVSDNSSRAAAEFTRRGTYMVTAPGLPNANGQTYSLQAGLFFELDDGLITRITGYYDVAEFLRQLS